MCEVKVVENQVRKNSIAQSVAKKKFREIIKLLSNAES